MQGSRQLFKWYLPEIKGGDTLSSISLSNSSDKYWSAIKERILPLKIGPQVQLSNTFHGSNWSPKNVSSYEGLIYPTSSLFFLGNQETTLMKMQGITSRVSSLTSTCEKMSKKSTVTWPVLQTHRMSNLYLTQLQILSSKKTSRTAGSSNSHFSSCTHSLNGLGIWLISSRKA